MQRLERGHRKDRLGQPPSLALCVIEYGMAGLTGTDCRRWRRRPGRVSLAMAVVPLIHVGSRDIQIYRDPRDCWSGYNCFRMSLPSSYLNTREMSALIAGDYAWDCVKFGTR